MPEQMARDVEVRHTAVVAQHQGGGDAPQRHHLVPLIKGWGVRVRVRVREKGMRSARDRGDG